MTLSRRELLRLAGGAAAGSGLAVIAAACSSRIKSREPAGPISASSLRTRLRELIDQLEASYPIATALALTGWRYAAGSDSGETAVSRRRIRTIRFEVSNGASWFAQTVDSTDPDILAAAVSRLRARAPSGPGGSRPTRGAEPRDFFRRGDDDVRQRGLNALLAKAVELRERSGEPATSRIIYRAGFTDASDVDTLFIGAGQDLRQSVVRVHAGVVMMSWNGVEMVAEQASRGGTGGLELATVGVDEIRAAVRRALALSAGPPPEGRDIEVVMSPSVVARLFAGGVVDLLDARRWQSGESLLSDFAGDQIADQQVSLSDDPTLEGGYGSYDFDHEGWLSSPRPLIHRGVVSGPFTDRRSAAAIGRGRTGHARLGDDGVRPRPSNLVIAAGGASPEELTRAVKSGFLLEGGLIARCDPLRWRVMLRVRRAREIRSGSLTGRVFGPATVRADVKSLLLGVRAVGSALTRLSLGDGVSIAAPHLLSRAEVGG